MILRIVGWLINLGEFLIALNLLTLLIAAFVKRFRSAAGGLLFGSAGVWAVALTVWSAFTVYAGWGWFLTILGLVLGGVGIVPVAFFCLAFSRDWMELGELIFQCALVTGAYYTAKRMMLEQKL